MSPLVGVAALVASVFVFCSQPKYSQVPLASLYSDLECDVCIQATELLRLNPKLGKRVVMKGSPPSHVITIKTRDGEVIEGAEPVIQWLWQAAAEAQGGYGARVRPQSFDRLQFKVL